MIKYKAREIAKIPGGPHDKSEKIFANIFSQFTKQEWRTLYLELTKYITESVNNYVPTGNKYDIDAYSQDTEKGKHKDINKALSKILKCRIPDIRLASSSSKDFVIYTNIFGVCQWYKSCGVTNLPTKYDPEYIITGDEIELNLYNSLIATIASLYEKDKEFNSVIDLQLVFCTEFAKFNNLDNEQEEIMEKFERIFEQLDEEGLIYNYHQTYYNNLKPADIEKIAPYKEIGEHYSEVILQKIKEEKGPIKTKKRK